MLDGMVQPGSREVVYRSRIALSSVIVHFLPLKSLAGYPKESLIRGSNIHVHLFNKFITTNITTIRKIETVPAPEDSGRIAFTTNNNFFSSCKSIFLGVAIMNEENRLGYVCWFLTSHFIC